MKPYAPAIQPALKTPGNHLSFLISAEARSGSTSTCSHAERMVCMRAL
jgi:hypothetical protein